MKLKYKFIVNQMGDGLVAIPTGDEVIDFVGVFKLNETAAFIVEALNEEILEESLIEKVSQEYNCGYDEAKENVLNIVKGLKEAGLIIE